MDRLIEQERAASSGDPEREARVWAEKLDECARLRAAYQDQQAAGLMTLDELASKLAELGETRPVAEREPAARDDPLQRVEQLEEDRDALIEAIADMVPGALDNLSGEERNKVYRMLRLEVTPTPEGYAVTGALKARLQNSKDELWLVTVKLLAFAAVLPSIFSEKVAVMLVDRETPVLPAVGESLLTLGAVPSLVIVKVQLLVLASAIPATFFAPVVTVTLNFVPAASSVFGPLEYGSSLIDWLARLLRSL